MKAKKILCAALAAMLTLPVAALAACRPENTDGGSGGGASGKNEQYVFEAEYTDVEHKQGAGLSNGQEGLNLIHGNGTEAEKAKGWSNGYYIAHTYKDGFSIDFEFTAAEAGKGTLVLRLASELGDLNLTPSSFGIMLNDKEVQYTSMQIPNSTGLDTAQFVDKTIPGEIELVQGKNKLSLIVRSNTFKKGESTGGPFIDCIKITTRAGLSWEPKTDNPVRRDGGDLDV